jgi:60 kDa SS-A/Ro ribonucleoprotein
MKYSNHIKKSNVAQTEQLSSNQVLNNAGGYVYSLDKWKQLTRFLILGCEGGTYYQSEKELSKDNAKNVLACIHEDGVRVVNELVDVSLKGRSSKNDAAIFVLALVCAEGSLEARQAAHKAIVKVCRTGTHLFTFCQAIKDLSGFGRGLKKGISDFYLSKNSDQLTNQLLKYRQRDGWTHRDVLRLVHTKTNDAQINELLNFAASSKEKLAEKAFNNKMLKAFLNLQKETDLAKMEKLAVDYIKEYDFTWEMIPSEVLNSKKVWQALVVNMPMTALIRNLGKLSTLEILTELSDVEKMVIQKITDESALKKARIHPIALLVAMKTYSSGHGFRGSNSWSVNQRIVAALEEAFYKSFGNVEATGKNLMLALDVSGSMTGATINNTNVTASEASAAMAMLALRTEQNVIIKGFSHELIDLKISAKDSLKSVCRYIDKLSFGSTDCALPIVYALKKNIKIDTFIIYTDNETYYGSIHPSEALKEYRKKVNPEAKMIVVGMTATNFSIADSNDSGMLDVVGFDTAAPQVMQGFIKGNL